MARAARARAASGLRSWHRRQHSGVGVDVLDEPCLELRDALRQPLVLSNEIENRLRQSAPLVGVLAVKISHRLLDLGVDLGGGHSEHHISSTRTSTKRHQPHPLCPEYPIAPAASARVSATQCLLIVITAPHQKRARKRAWGIRAPDRR